MAATLNGSGARTAREPLVDTGVHSHEHDEREDMSLRDLTSDLVGNAQELIRCEIELAKLELKAEAKVFAKGAALAGAGAVFGLVTLFMLAHTVAWLLDVWLPNWAAFGITTLLFGALAAGLAMAGKQRLEKVEAPTTAIDKTKEDVSWIKTHT